MNIEAALAWPALALVFAGVFAGLWNANRKRMHLLGFGVGFFALFLAMTVVIAAPCANQPVITTGLHLLACISVMAIVWGSLQRLNQRTPIFAMCTLSVFSSALLYLALENAEQEVALLVHNEASGLLFAIGAVLLWTARTTNMLDRILVWTMSLLAIFSLLRPIVLFYLQTGPASLVQHKIEASAASFVLFMVLTAMLGGVHVAIAIHEAIDIRHGSKRTDPVSGFLDQRTFELTGERALA